MKNCMRSISLAFIAIILIFAMNYLFINIYLSTAKDFQLNQCNYTSNICNTKNKNNCSCGSYSYSDDITYSYKSCADMTSDDFCKLFITQFQNKSFIHTSMLFSVCFFDFCLLLGFCCIIGTCRKPQTHSYSFV